MTYSIRQASGDESDEDTQGHAREWTPFELDTAACLRATWSYASGTFQRTVRGPTDGSCGRFGSTLAQLK